MWRHIKPILQVILLATAMLVSFCMARYRRIQQKLMSRYSLFTTYYYTKLRPIIVGFFYSCQFIKSFRPFHSFWEEEDLSGRSIQAFQNDTIIILWLFSFRVIQATVQWHTFKTFMFVFINSSSSEKNFFVKYLISIDLLWISETRYKPKLSHGLICHFMLDRLHWCTKQRNRTSVLLDELWYRPT